MPAPTFFNGRADLRRWLAKHGATTIELWVGFYKKGSGREGITYQEALDEALCAGWIDGLKKTFDEHSYMMRFTPRRPKSQWSLVNIRRARLLSAQGRMRPPGVNAFGARDLGAARRVDAQRKTAAFDAVMLRLFKAEPGAWEFFERQRPSYRRLCAFWVISAKKEETRARRLGLLIETCAAGRRMSTLAPAGHPPEKGEG